MRKQIASLTTIILSPFLIGLVLIIMASFEATASVFDALRWSLMLTALSLLPIFLFVVYLAKRKGLDSLFANVRQQRTQIYLLNVILTGLNCILMLLLKAPLILLALLVAGFTANVIFMSINLWWKISVHTAFIAAAVTLLFIIYGLAPAASVVLVPLVAWARIELEHHSLAQVVTGALSATSILLVVFYLFGVI